MDADYSSTKKKKWRSLGLVLSYSCLKVNLGVFLAGCTVGVVSYFVETITITCL